MRTRCQEGEYVEFISEDRQIAGVKPILLFQIGDGLDTDIAQRIHGERADEPPQLFK